MDYIATFFSHFGAMRFKKETEEAGGNARLMPVPRFLSSSCGTCCAFAADMLPTPSHPDEIEQIVKMTDKDRFEVIFSNL